MFRLTVLFAAFQATLGFQPFTASPSSRSPTLLQAVRDDTTADRRVFLGSSLAFFAAATTFPFQSLADEAAPAVDYKAVAADVADLVKANPDWGPTLVRLAWHSSGKCKCKIIINCALGYSYQNLSVPYSLGPQICVFIILLSQEPTTKCPRRVAVDKAQFDSRRN